MKFPINVILEDSILDNDVKELSRQVELHGSHILNQSDTRDRPLLIRTVMEGELPSFKFFLANEANVYITDNDGWTALHHAVSYDDVEMASELLKRDPRLTTVMTPNDYRPVDLAESPEMVSLLVQGNIEAFELEIKDVQLNSSTSSVQTLTMCPEKEESQLVQEILEFGDENEISKCLAIVEDRISCSLLHYSAQKNYTHLAWLLLQHKMVGVNLQDGNGQTALHVSAEYSHQEMIAVLKDFKASMTIKDNDGLTPKDLTDDMFTTDILLHNDDDDLICIDV